MGKDTTRVHKSGTFVVSKINPINGWQNLAPPIFTKHVQSCLSSKLNIGMKQWKHKCNCSDIIHPLQWCLIPLLFSVSFSILLVHSERYHVHFYTPNRLYNVDCEYVKKSISDNRFKRYAATNIALPKRLLGNIGRTVRLMRKIIRYSESASKSALGIYNVTWNIQNKVIFDLRGSSLEAQLSSSLHFLKKWALKSLLMLILHWHIWILFRIWCQFRISD